VQRNTTNLEHCIYREDHIEPASSYIIRSGETGSRTIVNYNNLPEMTVSEFKSRILTFDPTQETWWHFEVSSPPTEANFAIRPAN
jgi:ketohexokinase